MEEEGLTSKVRMKKYRSYRGQVGKIAPNIIDRDFAADKPNQKWTTDITEFSLFGKKLYLSPIMDLYNGEIISFNLATSPTVVFTNKSLEDALKTLPREHRLMIHTDQGFHYQHKSWINLLEEHNVTQSMSRRGIVWITLLWKISLGY